VASRLSSTTGSARGDRREPAAARVVEFSPRGRDLVPPANDNVRPTARRHLLRLLGLAVALALMAGGSIYFYLS